MTDTPARPRVPAVFFGHGSPMNALADNRYTAAWRAIGQGVDAACGRPEAILMVSAHWFTRGIGVTAMERPPTIHDFGGFPDALHAIEYPAPGSPALAARVRDLLAPVDVHLDASQWGLDHGTWSVLMHAYPKADVPVVQLSIDGARPPAWHLDLGRRLAPLRDAGVLVAGSGNVVHNLRAMDWRNEHASFEWAERFDAYVQAALARDDADALADYASQGEDARLSAPTPEHYLPLLYVLGARRAHESIRIAADGIQMGSVSMLSFVVGGPAEK